MIVIRLLICWHCLMVLTLYVYFKFYVPSLCLLFCWQCASPLLLDLWYYCNTGRRVRNEWLGFGLPLVYILVCFWLLSWAPTCRIHFRTFFCLPPSWFGIGFGMFSTAMGVLPRGFFAFRGRVDRSLVLSVAPFGLKRPVHPADGLRSIPLWSMMILLRSETELCISFLWASFPILGVGLQICMQGAGLLWLNIWLLQGYFILRGFYLFCILLCLIFYMMVTDAQWWLTPSLKFIGRFVEGIWDIITLFPCWWLVQALVAVAAVDALYPVYGFRRFPSLWAVLPICRVKIAWWILTMWEHYSSVVNFIQFYLQGTGQHVVVSGITQLYVFRSFVFLVLGLLYVFSDFMVSEDHWWFYPPLIFQGLCLDCLRARTCIMLFWALWHKGVCMSQGSSICSVDLFWPLGGVSFDYFSYANY